MISKRLHRGLIKTLRFTVFMLVSIWLVSGCGGGRKWEDLPADAAWAKILHKYNKKAYLDAIERLEIFLINHSGAPMVDSAQFVLADCHYKMKEYIISASEYEKLFMQYPQSTLAPEAEYMLGMSHYKLSPKYSLDQVYTEQAIEAFQLFIEDYPNSDLVDDATEMINTCRLKLARKGYENGRLYQKVKEYTSARIYYGMILENYYDTRYAPMALLHRAVTWEANKQWDEAISDYSLFLDKYRDHDWAGRALKGMNRVRSRIQENVTDESIDSSADASEAGTVSP